MLACVDKTAVLPIRGGAAVRPSGAASVPA